MSYIIPLEQQNQFIHGGGDDHDYDENLSSESDSLGVVSSDEYEDDDEEQETISSPLTDMSTLLQHLPIKRGLSKHYDGKSQSFTSLSSVKCLEDLPKVENSYNNKKKLKSCRSYGGLMFYSDQNPPATAATARAPCSSVEGYIGNNSNISTRPPIARSRTATSTIYTGALLFA
ncbi:uncharacterized protein LOC124921626 [Impatiens glandulifera]|uniref:uncharacterized protein LOC124921626 n=1 Tax=Impatiens glandulifera TaxID=253017 RepID=UPI001FB066F3|nr:uncharacterized protein LOC124921626 [Impatiens glandulifera]